MDFLTSITAFLSYSCSAILPGNQQNEALKQQREKEVKDNQELYKWGSDPSYSQDLPGFIEADTPSSLPKDVQFTDEASYSLFSTGKKGLVNLGLGDFFNLFEAWDSFDDFRKCITPVLGDLPPAAEQWRDDVWYGRQFLNGCNPETIKRCTSLPKKFPVTDEIVGNLLDRGTTLEDAMKVRD